MVFTGSCDTLLELLRKRRLMEMERLPKADGATIVIEGRKQEDPLSNKS
jgi:hypothetical protein